MQTTTSDSAPLPTPWSQELYLLPFSSLGERSCLLPFEMKEGLVKNVMELGAHTLEDAYNRLDDLERQDTSVWRMYQILQDMCSPRILVDKTPHNADHASFLEHAHAIFGSAASYCHLVRHPYSCISSGLELRRDVRPMGPPDTPSRPTIQVYGR